MKTHTSQFKEDIKTIGKQLDSKITFEIDGVTQILTSEDLNGVTPTFQGAILKSVMKELDIDSNVDIPIGTEINYKFGVKLEGNFEYLDYGNYIVYSSEKQEDTSSYKIVCYDKLLYSMKQNENLGITYPLSVRDYINALCTKIGLEFKNKNDEFANFDRILDKELYVGLDYTYRDILDELAQVTASTICLDSEDKVEIRYINDLSEFNTVSGNDLIINDGISYPIKKIVVDGKCEQETTTEYEPYTGGEPSPNPEYPQNINSITGDVKVNVIGKNLLVYPYFESTKTLSGIMYTDNGDGSININGTCTADNYSLFLLTEDKWSWDSISSKYELAPGKYVFKGTGTNLVSMPSNVYYEDGTNEFINVKASDVSKTLTRKAKLNCRITVSKETTVNNITIYPMISREGGEYEPYQSNSITIDLQENELCSINDIKDELVIENGNAKIIKRIGKYIINGSESIIRVTTNKTGIYRFNIIHSGIPTTSTTEIPNLLCSHFKTVSRNNTYDRKSGISSGKDFFQIYDDAVSLMTVAEFKTWLSNNNTIVYYVLATPQEIDLGQIDKLKTFEGINNMTLETNLETNMTLTYANGWETIDENFLKDINVNFGKKYGPVNSIVLSRSAESDNVYLQDEESIAQNGLCEIKIKDNQIMNWNDRSDYLPDILEKLDGLEYYLNDFSSTGIAYLDLCDRYNIKVFDNTYSCIMFNDEMKVTQGLEEDIHTDMPEETETDYTKADKTDRRINNVSLIVDKQGQRIDALAEKVQDISNTIKGSGIITLTDCSKTPLYKLVITGDDSLLFPSSKTYPSANTFTKNSCLYVNKGESDEKIYDLKIPTLRTLGNVKDEYILENTKAILIKRIGLNDNLEKYVLDEPIEIDMGTLTINLKEGTNTLQMPSFPLFSLEATYLLKNDYTDTFASTAYVNSEIEVTSDNILLESKSYTDRSTEGDELISRINLDSTGNVKIEASRTVDLTGTDINLTGDNVTINSDNFNVDKDGNMTCNNANAKNLKIVGGEIVLNDKEFSQANFKIKSDVEDQSVFLASWLLNMQYLEKTTVEVGQFYNAGSETEHSGKINLFGKESGLYLFPKFRDEEGIVSTISLNGSNGKIVCVTLTQTSLKENKKNFEKYSNALKELDNIDIYKYNLKDEKDTDKKHLGFVIGENFKYSETVTSNDNQGVDNYSFTSLCFQMIKEQQEIINKLEKRVDDLENKLKSVIIERESDK